jgi:hypothetical protein
MTSTERAIQPKPTPPRLCAECRRRVSQWAKLRSDIALANGKCPNCLCRKLKPGRRKCAKCLAVNLRAVMKRARAGK